MLFLAFCDLKILHQYHDNKEKLKSNGLFLKLNTDLYDLDIAISLRKILEEKIILPVTLLEEISSNSMKEDLLYNDVLVPAGIVFYLEKTFKVNKEEASNFYLTTTQPSSDEEDH